PLHDAIPILGASALDAYRVKMPDVVGEVDVRRLFRLCTQRQNREAKRLRFEFFAAPRRQQVIDGDARSATDAAFIENAKLLFERRHLRLHLPPEHTEHKHSSPQSIRAAPRTTRAALQTIRVSLQTIRACA